tara:strand:- start:2400 stop:2957 length:558 start_codon:yes stop_codon:yes gene_type:complete
MPSKKYSKKDFNKDLNQLKKLIKSHRGGDSGSVSSDPMPHDTSQYGNSYGNFDGTPTEHLTSPGPIGAIGGGKAKPKTKPKPKAKRSTVKADRRSFTIVEVDGKKLPSGEGRYSKASNACSRALSKRNKNKLVIKVRETTAGSDKTVKCYDCSRTKLAKPLKIEIKGSPPYFVYYTPPKIKERVK